MVRGPRRATRPEPCDRLSPTLTDDEERDERLPWRHPAWPRMSALWALAVVRLRGRRRHLHPRSVLPEIADSLGEPIGAVGLLASAYALPTALLAPVFGPFSDRHGRQAAMTLGLLVFIGSAAACIVAPSLPLLLVARAVNGLGAAIIVPAAFAYAGDLPTTAERGRAMGLLAAAISPWRRCSACRSVRSPPSSPDGAARSCSWLIGVLALVLVRLLCKDDRAATPARRTSRATDDPRRPLRAAPALGDVRLVHRATFGPVRLHRGVHPRDASRSHRPRRGWRS